VVKNIGVTEADLAYIAGLLDGEGALFIGKYARAGNRFLAYRGYMSIVNTHIPMLQQVQSAVGGKIVRQGAIRKCYALTFSANEIRDVLPRLQPFLIIKKVQAELLLKFLETQKGNGVAPIIDSLLTFYEECYQKMKRLHHLHYDYQKPTSVSLGLRSCYQCGKRFDVFSCSPKKKYCSDHCARKTHWTRSNANIAAKKRAVEEASSVHS